MRGRKSIESGSADMALRRVAIGALLLLSIFATGCGGEPKSETAPQFNDEGSGAQAPLRETIVYDDGRIVMFTTDLKEPPEVELPPLVIADSFEYPECIVGPTPLTAVPN